MYFIRKSLVASISVFLLFSVITCSILPRKKTPVIAPLSAKQKFKQINKKRKQASTIKQLKKLIQQHPDSDIVDISYLLIGDTYFKLGNYRSAFRSYMSVSQSEFFSAKEADSLFLACRSLQKLGRIDETLSLSKKALAIAKSNNKALIKIHRLRYSLQSQIGDNLDALQSLWLLSNISKEPGRKKNYLDQAIEFLSSRLSEGDLKTVSNESDFGLIRTYAMFNVALKLFEEKDFSAAKPLFQDIISDLPNSDIAELSEQNLEQIEAQRRVHPTTIGVILPLSGRHAKMAYKTLRGLQLGLGIFGKNPSQFKLAIIDSEGNPDIARRAVEKLVVENHVIAIVGSLLSRTAIAVAAKADELGVPSIALSQKSGITDVGDTVFRNALTSELQIQKLVDTAINLYGIKRFAILYPNDRYGVEYANLFWNHVVALGGEIRGAQAYNNKKNDFGGAIQRLVGTFYLEDRKDEYKYNLIQWMTRQKVISSRGGPPADLLTPDIDFEAIFIPDTIKKVQQIAPTLSYYDIDNIRLLGTNLWNSPRLTKRSKEFLEGSLFIDSMLSTDSSFISSVFFREFSSTFGVSPGVMEAQAYDSALILRQLISSGETSRIGLINKLSSIEGFSGALGNLEVSARREFIRPVVSLEVSSGKITPVNKVK